MACFARRSAACVGCVVGLHSLPAQPLSAIALPAVCTGLLHLHSSSSSICPLSSVLPFLLPLISPSIPRFAVRLRSLLVPQSLASSPAQQCNSKTAGIEMKEGRSSERQSHNKRGKEEREAAGNASRGQGKGKPKYCTRQTLPGY